MYSQFPPLPTLLACRDIMGTGFSIAGEEARSMESVGIAELTDGVRVPITVDNGGLKCMKLGLIMTHGEVTCIYPCLSLLPVTFPLDLCKLKYHL